LLLSAMLRTRAAAAGRPALSIDIFCTYGAQQQTRRTPLLRFTDVTDGRTDTGSFYRPCSAYYAQCQKVSPVVKSPMLSLTEFSAKIHVLLLLLVF